MWSISLFDEKNTYFKFVKRNECAISSKIVSGFAIVRLPFIRQLKE